MASAPRIVFAVTVDDSIKLLGKIPSELAKDGWDVHVVSAPGSGLDALEKEGLVTCHRLPMERNPHALRDFSSLLRWIKTLKGINPNVVSFGTPKASLLGLAAAWLLRVPARVYLLRGLRLESAGGLERCILSYFEKLTSACATHIVSVSHSLRTVYLANNLADPSKVLVLGHGSSKGVELKRFRPARPDETMGLKALAARIGLQTEVPVIGLVGRQHIDKGIRLFADALVLLGMQNVTYQVLVVGEDESGGLLTELLRDVASHSVVIDKTSEIELFYRLMTVLCLPTQREGMPNVVLEALASGTPVITTDATGATDSIEDGLTGIRVSRGSSEELSLALFRGLTDPGLQHRLSSHSRPWVKERFSDSKVLRFHKEFYERVLTEDPNTPKVKKIRNKI